MSGRTNDDLRRVFAARAQSASRADWRVKAWGWGPTPFQKDDYVMRIDFHVHVAGLGIGNTGCYISPRRLKSPTFRYLRWQLGMPWSDVHERLDEIFCDRVVSSISGSAHIDAALVYAHDRIYDRNGRVRGDLTEVYSYIHMKLNVGLGDESFSY